MHFDHIYAIKLKKKIQTTTKQTGPFSFKMTASVLHTHIFWSDMINIILS
jgi:hypothetical protein